MDIDEIVFIVEEDKEVGGYSAVCQRYGIFTQGEDLDDLRAMVKDAVDCRFDGEPIPGQQIRLHFVRDEVIAA
jgi:predicted RNase H-like HicB family nuclease